MNLKARTYLWYLAIIRVYAGYYLLNQGIRKFQRDFPKGDWIGRQIGDLNTVEFYPWYKNLFQEYVVPHHELYGYLVMYGEIAVGACLLLGLFTRISAIVGLFMVLNYFLSIGLPHGGAALANQQIFMIILAIFVLANPGRTVGLDGLLFSGGGGSGAKGKGAR